jgi:cobyrinic acid a,c-diamide synthase
VVMVVDVRGQAASVAALLRGFAGHRADVAVVGVIFNRVGGEAHAETLRRAVAPLGLPVLGCLPRAEQLRLPERHLGLVQAGERTDLPVFLEAAADIAEQFLDLRQLRSLARIVRARDSIESDHGNAGLPPLGQRIAVARDIAFAFAYPALLEHWRDAGAELSFFSPLADEAPPADADAIYLPGGYPELHAGRLAGNGRFMNALRAAAGRSATIFGECGGYMVLGAGLVDADGESHAMTALLPLQTSFTERRLHLGYRRARLATDCALGVRGAAFRGHEFHYAVIEDEGRGEPLFQCDDARGGALGGSGRRAGTVFGSFLHLIDRADQSHSS